MDQIDKDSFRKAVELGLSPTPTSQEEEDKLRSEFLSGKPDISLYSVAARKFADEGDDASAQKLRAYAALNRPEIASQYGDPEAYQSALESARAEAEPLFNEADAKRFAVRNGLAKIATFNENGKTRIEVADDVSALDDKQLADYAAANRQYVSPKDLLAVRDYLKPAEGFSLTPAQLQKKHDLHNEILKLTTTDKRVADLLDRGTKGFELDERTTGMKVVQGAGALAAGGFVAMGSALNELMGGETKYAPAATNAERIADELASTALSGRYSKDQIREVVNDMITVRGIDSLDVRYQGKTNQDLCLDQYN